MIAAMFSVFTLASSADDDYTLADGVLTVKADIECNTKEYPWHANRAEVTKVVVADGVTKVGHHAFTLMENLTEITFGKDCTKFGDDAFSGCPNLKTVTFNAPVTSIGQGIAYNSKAIETVNLYNQSEEAFKTLAAAKLYNLASNGGISTGFDTPAREIYSDGTFVRIAVCEYGIIPDATHAYTVSLEFSDVATGKVKYAGTSAVGAFNKPSATFTEPIIPNPIPHPQVPEATKIKIEGKYGDWENWGGSPNKGRQEDRSRD